MKQLITVATFNDRKPAEVLEQRLEDAGVHVEIFDESSLQSSIFLAKKPLAQIRLRVDKTDLDRTEKLLKEWNAIDGAMREAVHCPECGSSRIEYPQFTRKFWLPSVVAFFCRLGLFDAEFYCEDCHFTWPPEEAPKPDLDKLNWPTKGRF
jgi:hypothetical protein